MKKYYLFFVSMLFSCGFLYSQNKTDSLLVLLKNDRSDTNKVKHLNKLCWAYLLNGSNDSAFLYGNSSLLLLDSLSPKENNPKVIKKLFSIAYNNMGIVYDDRANFPKAQENYLKALKLGEEIQDKNKIANSLGNLGIVYEEQGEYDKALDYYLRAVKQNEELGDKRNVAGNLCNIGIVYKKQTKYSMAIEYYLKALKLAEEINDKHLITTCIGNLGSTYYEMKNYDLALNYYNKAQILYDSIGDKNGIARNWANLGALYMSQKQFLKAYDYLYRSLALFNKIRALDNLNSTYNTLSLLYEKSDIPLPDSIGGKLLSMDQMLQRSLYYYKRHVSIKDSLFSDEKNKEITRHELNYEFDKKEAAFKAELDKKEAVAEADKKRQNIFFWLISMITIAITVIAIIVFRSLRVTRKQKHIIEHQKEVVEEKQKEILDSIRYAKRIQGSLLPTEKYIEKNLKRLKDQQ